MQERAADLAAHLVEVVSASYDIEGHKVVVGCSIGIAFAPDHGGTCDELLKCSDVALYKAKNAGRGCYCIYGAEFEPASLAIPSQAA